MDVIGGCAARLDRRAPTWADRVRWRREREIDYAKRIVERLVRRDDVALDIGANRGLFTSRLLRLVGRGGGVHAFEPNPEFERRLMTIGRNKPLEVHIVALSDHAGADELSIPRMNGARDPGLATLHRPGSAESERVTVAVNRLDDVVIGSGHVDFVKCDVEGHEDAVLAGGEEVIRAHKPTVLIELEERHRIRPIADAIAWFDDHGYSGWAVFPDGLRPIGRFDAERDQMRHLGEGRPSPDYVHDFVFAARPEILDIVWRHQAQRRPYGK